jgi:pimeloyl-ACP methyl ester carboxylesterase
MPHVNLDGTRFYYQQAGQGPDVVLIHAVTSNSALWVFVGVLDALAEEFRVTAYDLRGHGNSDVTPTGYTSGEMARDFLKLHSALNLGPAYLVGHSFGAVIAMHAAVLAPECVAGLILSDPYFPGLQEVEPRLGQAGSWQDLKRTLAPAGVELGDTIDFAYLFRAIAKLTPEQMATLKQHVNPGTLRWMAQLPRLAPTTCGTDVFAVAGLTAEKILSVRQPVVALYDEHTDFAATRRFLEENLPNCTIETVPGASHFAPLQNPTGFIELVRKHLRNLRSTAGPQNNEADPPMTPAQSVQ